MPNIPCRPPRRRPAGRWQTSASLRQQPGAGEVLVRVKAAGICHSDAHYRAGVGSTRHPLTLGHEDRGRH